MVLLRLDIKCETNSLKPFTLNLLSSPGGAVTIALWRSRGTNEAEAVDDPPLDFVRFSTRRQNALMQICRWLERARRFQAIAQAGLGLKRTQRMRLVQPVAPRIDVNVSSS
jgi:hypothetical protein